IDDFHQWARKRALSIGLVQPNEEEQAAMDEAAENAEPDPMAKVAEAEAYRLQTEGALNEVEAAETESKTALNEAKTIETLAKAGKARAEVIRPASWGA